MAVKNSLTRMPTLETDVTSMIEKLAQASTTDEKVAIIRRISPKLGAREAREKYAAVVQSSKLIQTLYELLTSNKEWASNPPPWAKNLVSNVYFELQFDVPSSETLLLLNVFKHSCIEAPNEVGLEMIKYILYNIKNRELLLHDNELYDILKSSIVNKDPKITQSGISCLLTATDNNIGWQNKVLQDKKLISDILALPTSASIWYLLANLSLHPDAKVLMPPEVLERAKRDKSEGCIDVYANLISEADADSLVLNAEYMENRVNFLRSLLEIQDQVGVPFNFSLLDLILPFVNLSVSDSNKEMLGKLLSSLLLQVVAIRMDKPLISNIATNLDRAKQEASKALWNLAFTESNRKRISDARGLATLNEILGSTKDSILKKNISGILYMFENHEAKPPNDLPANTARGHVMISYNWDNQPTILRLAHSLKERGYNVWLDVEQMNGSTLSAMADAVEGSELVLMCMSRKYKDSPNCRLEGEYIVNRKVTFIPLMLQTGYRPDGWLGITLGAKLYHDFTNEDDWDNKVAALVKGMGNLGKGTSVANISTTKLPEAHTPPPAKVSPLDWKPEELLSWMQAEGIEKYHTTFVKQKIDGRALLEMKSLLLSPQNVLSFLFEQLGIYEIGELFRITSAIRKL